MIHNPVLHSSLLFFDSMDDKFPGSPFTLDNKTRLHFTSQDSIQPLQETVRFSPLVPVSAGTTARANVAIYDNLPGLLFDLI